MLFLVCEAEKPPRTSPFYYSTKKNAVITEQINKNLLFCAPFRLMVELALIVLDVDFCPTLILFFRVGAKPQSIVLRDLILATQGPVFTGCYISVTFPSVTGLVKHPT